MIDYDLTIIGAGAAGLAAAIFAGEATDRRQRIVLLDGARKPGAKILVSGGGRCNVTNEQVMPEDYCGGSSKIIRNVIRTFDERQTVRWMESLGVPLKLEPTGKFFPESDSARTVLEALMGRVRELGIETRFGYRVSSLQPSGPVNRSTEAEQPTGWQITNAVDNTTITAGRVILATGGKALPKSGSDGCAYPWLTRLGHTIVPPVPALAPLILDERGLADSPLSRAFADLSGVTIDARLEFEVSARSVASFTGSTLFTHFGLSGPAPMNLSRHIARHRLDNPAADPGHLRIGLPQFDSHQQADSWLLDQIAARPKAGVGTSLARLCPERMANALAAAVKADRLGALTREERQLLARLLAGSPVAVKGDRGFSFAEATAGGAELGEVNWRTMESRKAPGLYLCGEVLDVDGRIGGFNFQWAWASGRLAGLGACGAG